MSAAAALSISRDRQELAARPASFREPAPLASEADLINPLLHVGDSPV